LERIEAALIKKIMKFSSAIRNFDSAAVCPPAHDAPQAKVFVLPSGFAARLENNGKLLSSKHTL